MRLWKHVDETSNQISERATPLLEVWRLTKVVKANGHSSLNTINGVHQ